MASSVFRGTIPALMTPCRPDRTPDFDALVRRAGALVEAGMSAVVYCGSMGDWPLLDDAQRKEGVERLVGAGIPVIVGTGAQSPARAVALAAHAKTAGARGLMVIPRVLSRGTSAIAQRAHFEAILEAAGDLPAVIYNSPHYGFETRAELFFALRARHANLVGFKEFGGAAALRYAAEHITGGDPSLALLVGVDTPGLSRLRQLRRGRRDHGDRQCPAEGSAPSGRAVRARGHWRRHGAAPGARAGRGAGRPVFLRRGDGSRPFLQVSACARGASGIRAQFRAERRAVAQPAPPCRVSVAAVQGVVRVVVGAARVRARMT